MVRSTVIVGSMCGSWLKASGPHPDLEENTLPSVMILSFLDSSSILKL